MPSRPSTRSLAAALTLVPAALGGAGLLAASALTALADSRALIRLTYERMVGLEAILARMGDAAISERGYLLTKDPAQIRRYQSALLAVGQELERLAATPFADPQAAHELARLRRLLSLRLAAAVHAFDGSGSQPALRPETVGQTDAVRQQAKALLAEERRVLDERLRTAKRVDRTAAWKLGVCGMLGLAVVGGAGVMLMRQQRGRAQADAKRHTAEHRSQRLAEALDETQTLIRDADGTILHWTKGIGHLYGWTHAQAVGRVSHELLDTRFPAPLERINEILWRTGRWTGELNHRRADQSRFTVMSLWLLERDPGGRARVIEVNTDVTELRRTQDDLRALYDNLEHRVAERTAQLQDANRELDGFAYTISHDLRAPLRAMEGYAEALIEDAGDLLTGEPREFADRIVAAARRMDDLIEDVLAYSRLSRIDLRPQSVPLPQLMARILRDMGEEIAERRAVVETDPELPAVLADPTALKLALTNLLSNALKFVAPGISPQVRIRAEPRRRDGAAPAVRLWIEDNGIGIAPEHQVRIFKPFERLHGTDHYPGTGVGLGIVKRAMERSGGSYGVESNPGRGSRFWIELPPAATPSPTRDAAELEEAQHDRS